MGRTAKLHSAGRERKQQSIANVVNEGYDPLLEDECRAFKADDELRPYWVDKCLAQRVAAAEALAVARQAKEAPAAPAPRALEAPADPDDKAPDAPADEVPDAPAGEAPDAPAENPAAAN